MTHNNSNFLNEFIGSMDYSQKIKRYLFISAKSHK